MIAGYNTETKCERDKYNVLEVSKFMAIVAYVNVFFYVISTYYLFSNKMPDDMVNIFSYCGYHCI